MVYLQRSCESEETEALSTPTHARDTNIGAEMVAIINASRTYCQFIVCDVRLEVIVRAQDTVTCLVADLMHSQYMMSMRDSFYSTNVYDVIHGHTPRPHASPQSSIHFQVPHRIYIVYAATELAAL